MADRRHDGGPRAFLPSARPVRFLTDEGAPARGRTTYPEPSPELLDRAYRAMVIGRRFDAQATALTKQGRLAVYPSSHGQEACQVGAVLALAADDWLFPTYRDSVALVTRGIDPVEVLSLLRGDAHCGYDPRAHHTAPQCTPLATQTLHAAGLAYAERRKGTGRIALAFIGDGATSEGDFHEALNFAAVFSAPVVFFIQNNRYAISVPLEKQTAAPTLSYKGVGYGVRSEQVDGNDPVAVLAVLQTAVEHARSGAGPFLVEAHTYRIGPHTNADDATRYRTDAEVEHWRRRDPIARLETYLRRQGRLTDDAVAAVAAEAEEFAARLRTRMNADPELAPMELFDHVYDTPTPQLREQRALLGAELEAEEALA
jgi:pyruvate dehydrogenase E1 component alpha subunit